VISFHGALWRHGRVDRDLLFTVLSQARKSSFLPHPLLLGARMRTLQCVRVNVINPRVNRNKGEAIGKYG